MKKFLLAIFAFIFAFTACDNSQKKAAADEQKEPIVWNTHIEKAEGDNEYRVIFTGKIKSGYHTYTLTDKYSATSFMENETYINGGELVGEPYEINKPVEELDEYEELAKHFYDEIIICQKVVVTAPAAEYIGTLFSNVCTGGACSSNYYSFKVNITPENAVMAISEDLEEVDDSEVTTDTISEEVEETTEVEESSIKIVVNNKTQALLSNPKAYLEVEKESIWGQILQAILWGFIMLLTPCVFPMVPMTVSFFLKGSDNVAAGRFKALMYGVFIVLIYTVPIAVLILITRFVGGDAVTANIFNWIATHWLPNILFFIIFMIFAASFFGAFEITLPQSIVNKSDQNSDKKGLAGVFFMALTLVLVSFSCTGPIVGNVLIEATSSGGSFMTPILVMLAFSTAFAIPFTIFAFSPTLLKKFKKSGGGWLNSVKVVIGFVELALGLKFLSVADMTYHWGILDREIYLAIWIVIFSLLGFYLLGKIRFAHDEPVEKLSVGRLSLAIAVFSFVVYMIPGMWGAPLKGLSGYLPPMSTHDFIVYNNSLEGEVEIIKDFEDALNKAEKEKKPIFVDVTGYGCVNCREMEARVWSDPAVKALMSQYVVAALHVDDKDTSLPEDKWIQNIETGQIYKTAGPAYAYLTETLYKTTTQPTYILLKPNGEILIHEKRNYDLNIPKFVEFLTKGLQEFEKLYPSAKNQTEEQTEEQTEKQLQITE